MIAIMGPYRRWIVAILVVLFFFFWHLSRMPTVASPRLSTSQVISGKQRFTPLHAPTSLLSLPSGLPQQLPPMQHKFATETKAARVKRESRRDEIKKTFRFAWQGYREHAWLKDELRPVTGGFRGNFGGWAATMVDSLDSLWILGLRDEFEHAVKAASQIDFTDSASDKLDVFETNIRYLGGFLGAYDVSNGRYPILLEKAIEVADFFYSSFDTPTRVPTQKWFWKAALAGAEQRAQSYTFLSLLGSFSLELTRLSQLTGDMKYFDASERMMQELAKSQQDTRVPGLWPTFVDGDTLDFSQSTFFSLGACADSTYEYLPKQFLLVGGRTQTVDYQDMYRRAIKAADERMFFRPMLPDNADILFPGLLEFKHEPERQFIPESGHLSCYIGGAVGLAAKLDDDASQLDMARKLTHGCAWAYNHTTSGVMPEGLTMRPCDDRVKCRWDDSKDLDDSSTGFTIIGSSYTLRPEAIESLFVLYRLTGDANLLDTAWAMFQSIERITRTNYGHSSVDNVSAVDGGNKTDNMPSFWLTETLKYFYLIFETPDVVSLDDFVL